MIAWLVALLLAVPLAASAQTLTIQAKDYTAISTPGPVLKPSTGAMNAFATGQWMSYTVMLPAAGRYRVDLQAATTQTGTRWSVSLDDVLLGTTTVGMTTSWNTYMWQNGPVVLVGAGTHTLTLTAAQQYFDPMALRFTLLELIVGLGGTGTPGPPGPAGPSGPQGPPGQAATSPCTASTTVIGGYDCPFLTLPGLHVTGDAVVDGNIGAKYQ